jgi:hypothetical protein
MRLAPLRMREDSTMSALLETKQHHSLMWCISGHSLIQSSFISTYQAPTVCWVLETQRSKKAPIVKSSKKTQTQKDSIIMDFIGIAFRVWDNVNAGTDEAWMMTIQWTRKNVSMCVYVCMYVCVWVCLYRYKCMCMCMHVRGKPREGCY